MANDTAVNTKPDEGTQLPSVPVGFQDEAPILAERQLVPALRIMLDQQLYEQVKRFAGIMARDTTFTRRHLQNKPEACFVVITQALTWNLDPLFVARATYQTPGGEIGFEGKLVHAILASSHRFIGAPKIEYVGDWSKVAGKFEKSTSQNGKEYMRRTWTEKDAAGLGVILRWQVRGETEPRVWPGEKEPFFLTQCWPLNSTLWATDPKTQIAYLAMRRFANAVAPEILGGMPFDHEELFDAAERAKDVTPPRPTREQFMPPPAPTPEPEPEPYEVYDCVGECVLRTGDAQEAVAACRKALDEGKAQRGAQGATAVWDNNAGLIDLLHSRGFGDVARALGYRYADVREAAAAEAKTMREKAPPPDPRPRSALFDDPLWAVELPKLLDGSVDFERLRDTLVLLVSQCENWAELDKLGADNETTLTLMRQQAPELRAEVGAAIEDKRLEFAAARDGAR
jgi:hypothetical protein